MENRHSNSSIISATYVATFLGNNKVQTGPINMRKMMPFVLECHNIMQQMVKVCELYGGMITMCRHRIR